MDKESDNFRPPGEEETRERLAGAKRHRSPSGHDTNAELDVPGPLGSALDRIKDGFIIVDSGDRIVYANNAGKSILGRYQVAGMDLSAVYPGPANSKLVTSLNVARLEKKEIKLVEYISHAFKWYYVTIYPSGDHTTLFFRESTLDFRLDEQYRLTHFSVENFLDYAFWVKMSGQISYANKSVREKLGYSTGDLAIRDIYQIVEKLKGIDWDAFTQEVRKKKYLAFESPVKTSHGDKIIGDVQVNYLIYKGQEYLVIFIKDITARKRAEEEREDARAQAELYLDLMGHDINNLNQVALGYLELLNDMIEDKQLKELVSKPLDAIASSSRLIDNVRKLKNAKGLKTEAVDLSEVLDGLRAQYSKVSDKDVTINFKPEHGSFVLANGLIQDLFSNLIWNTIKHSDEKKVLIDLAITRSRKEGKEYYEVAVEDHGPGIPDELKIKLFSRFQKGNMKAYGKGMGLYLVRTLVEDFHGKVWVEDRVPGEYTKGSRFVVLLPAIV